MVANKFTFLNTGIYSLPEASRLTQVSIGRIRRWLRGYKYLSGGARHHSPAVWRGQLDPIDNTWALGFLDLVEIKHVDSFVKAGVGWATLRRAHNVGVKVFKQSHPFCTHRFATDGRSIFSEDPDLPGEKSLLEIIKDQRVFSEIISPFFKELEFEAGDVLARWRPKTKSGLVVLDPTRSFGHPIISSRGVPTEVLAKAYAACGSIQEVSRWFEASRKEIEDAIEFENKLAA